MMTVPARRLRNEAVLIMAPKKAKKQDKKKSKRPTATGEPINWRLVRARSVSACIALLLIAGIVAAVVGREPLRRHVAEVHTAAYGPVVHVAIDWPEVATPAGTDAEGQPVFERMPYVGWEMARQVEVTASQLASADPFDLASVEAVSAYVEDTGWPIAPVRALRSPNGIIEIEADWRMPRWVVRHDGFDYVIGDDLGLLPLAAATDERAFRYVDGTPLRFVEGVYAGPPTNERTGLTYGDRWPGTDLQDAISLLSYLARADGVWDQVRGVRIEYGWDGCLFIVTDAGSSICWGRPPGQENGIEIAASSKIASLRAARQHTGRIDWGEDRIDIRTEQYEIDRTVDGE
jgi:hypothetical protein